MKEIAHPIINRPHEYKLVYLGIIFDDDDYRNSYIDIHLRKGAEFKRLRFTQPTEIEIEKGFNGNLCGMEILDIRQYKLDNIGVKVRNFEQDPGITFLAKQVVELKE